MTRKWRPGPWDGVGGMGGRGGGVFGMEWEGAKVVVGGKKESWARAGMERKKVLEQWRIL